jgi:hypothetical protein
MKRDYIPGLDVDGEWTCDEDGVLLRSQRIAARAFAEVAVPFNDLMLADLDWQAHCERLGARLDTVEAEDAREAAHEFGARVQADYEALGASDAVGLVSVLSRANRANRKNQQPVPPSRPFRVQAERAACVQQAGAFIAGGDDARMAKLRRAVGFAARAHGAARKGHRPDEVRMVTLTYRPGVEWESLHVKRYMDHVRLWHKRRGVQCRYVWVAEIQDGKRRTDGGARGAVHYHVALWVPQGTPHMPMSDKQGWWPHGSTRTELANGAVQYLMHYLKKGNSKTFKDFPDGCRIYSVGGLDHSLRRARRWLGLPGFVQANSSYLDDWRRAPVGTGGGWHDPAGSHWASEFRRVNCGGVYALQRVHTHARTIDASGPFSWLTDRSVALQRSS